MKTFSHLCQYLAEFLMELEIFQIKVVEKITIHTLRPVTPPLPPESCRLCENVKNIVWSLKGCKWQYDGVLHVGLVRLHAHKQTPARVHQRSHKHARARTHTHTTKCVILAAFARQQWFRKRASILRYTYVVCLVKTPIVVLCWVATTRTAVLNKDKRGVSLLAFNLVQLRSRLPVLLITWFF